MGKEINPKSSELFGLALSLNAALVLVLQQINVYLPTFLNQERDTQPLD
jgi:hypothetical protein